MKRKTLKDLEAELVTAYGQVRQRNEEIERLRGQLHALQREKDAITKHGVALEQQLEGYKAQCDRMRGYIARVQEDDREDGQLITVGETDGEQQLVAKRKPTDFGQPFHGGGEASFGYGGAPARRRVTY